MVTLEILYNAYETITNKDSRGNTLSIPEFSNLAARAQLDFTNQKLKDFEESLRITDSLQSLITTDTDALSGASKPLPDDYAQVTSFIADNGSTDVKVDLVTAGEYEFIMNDELSKPTISEPVYRIRGGSIYVYPSTTFATAANTFEYIKYPDTPNLDYYIDVNGRYQLLDVDEVHTWTTNEIDSTGTVHTTGDPDWLSLTVELSYPDKDKWEIFLYMLTAVGVKISSNELVQFGMSETIKLDTDD